MLSPTAIVQFVSLLVLLIVLSYLYARYQNKLDAEYGASASMEDVRKYLLKREELGNAKKPILWIHVPYEYNSRRWLDFGSRNSFDLNQPYLYLTARSIIEHCDASFKVVLIDDATFGELLPNWTISVPSLPEPIRKYVRQLCLAKLIHMYGGMTVPISFLCLKNLAPMYKMGTDGNTMFVCENLASGIQTTHRMYMPDLGFFGAPRECETVRELISFMEQKISQDYTAQMKFLDDFNRWCENKVANKQVRLIPATEVGVRSQDGLPVTVEMLFERDYISFYGGMYGIWIPADAILKRKHYEWFAHIELEQLLDSQFILAKYFVIALSNQRTRDAFQTLKEDAEQDADKKKARDWIGFWRVPLSNGTLNVWGMMPMGLGNDVPRAKSVGDLVH